MRNRPMRTVVHGMPRSGVMGEIRVAQSVMPMMFMMHGHMVAMTAVVAMMPVTAMLGLGRVGSEADEADRCDRD